MTIMAPRARTHGPALLGAPSGVPLGRRAGLTTVELLVVLAIVGFVATLSVPLVLSFSQNPNRQADQATRDLFTQFKAARVYAGTHNVETGLAYGGRLSIDSATNEAVPIIGSIMIVRRLKHDELEYFGLGSVSSDVFIPVANETGKFRRIASEGCILSDVFETTTAVNGAASLRGLSEGFIIEPQASGPGGVTLIEPISVDLNENGIFETNERFNYRGVPFNFPMHLFQPSGEFSSALTSTKQRVQIHLGVSPDTAVGDRFPDGAEAAAWLPTPLVAHVPTVATLLRNPADTAKPAEINVSISLYLAQGRVKVES